MANRFAVNFNAKIKPERPLNDEFLLCKCYTMALNKNRNRSYISKQAADDAMGTLYNIPVIGHLYVDEEGNYHMGGHDVEIAKTEDGKYVFRQLTVPYGVVPQQDNVHYEEVEEQDGTKNTYLVSDIILWVGRYPELKEAVYDKNGTLFNQSMEISVNESEPLEEDSNYTNILSYSYSALCLLGKSSEEEYHVEPCFPSARVDVYDFSLDDEFMNLMAQLKDGLAFCFGADSKTEDVADNNAEDSADETVENRVEFDESENSEGVRENEDAQSGEGDPTPTAVGSTDFQSTYREKHDILADSLPNNTVYDGDEVVRHVSYYLCDFDDSFVFVERYEWIRGGDSNNTKGRFAYSYDEKEKKASVTGDFEEMFVRWVTREELERIEADRAKYEELIQYRNDREQKDREAEFDVAIAEFSDMSDIDEFESISSNRYSYESVQDLKNACYMVRGKYAHRFQKPKQSDPVIPIGGAVQLSLRDQFHERYGKKK